MIIISVFLLILLLFFPSVAATGSRYGAALWLTELLPTLLPFFIVIRLFRRSLPAASNRRPFLLIGLLSGYPSGAALVAGQYKNNCFGKKTAYFYLGFVNNPSPAFILIFCGKNVLGLSGYESLGLLLIVIFSSFAGSFLFRLLYHPAGSETKYNVPLTAGEHPPKTGFSSAVLDHIITDSFRIMAIIGGYVILFSIAGQFLHTILPGESILSYLLCGMTEISSGISYLKLSLLSSLTKKVLTTVMLAFGGLSAAFQTSSVLTSSELSIFPYLLNKILNSILAGFTTFLLFRIF